MRFWDPRASSQQQSSHEVPERVYNMDLVNHILVVAMASRLFHIYDIRKMDSPAQTRESSLKFMTRALACMSDGQGVFLFFTRLFSAYPPFRSGGSSHSRATVLHNVTYAHAYVR